MKVQVDCLLFFLALVCLLQIHVSYGFRRVLISRPTSQYPAACNSEKSASNRQRRLGGARDELMGDSGKGKKKKFAKSKPKANPSYTSKCSDKPPFLIDVSFFCLRHSPFITLSFLTHAHAHTYMDAHM